MKHLSRLLIKILNIFVTFSLVAMAILVFINVVLRYFFGSGITWSEEISRFLFIWLTYLGAIVGLKDNEHLGVDTVINRLPKRAKKIVYIVANVLILYCLLLVIDGSWKMALLNVHSFSPTGLPLILIYGIVLVSSVAMGLLMIFKLYQALFEKGGELVLIKESEETISLKPNMMKEDN